MNIEFRDPSPFERGVFEVLLKNRFPGRDELARQLDSCQVKVLDKEGSLEIRVLSESLAPVVRRIPVELYANDKDGVTIHVLLHVCDGKAAELEFYKDDSSMIKQLPEQWEILIL